MTELQTLGIIAALLAIAMATAGYQIPMIICTVGAAVALPIDHLTR
jgi:hypothetical protein